MSMIYGAGMWRDIAAGTLIVYFGLCVGITSHCEDKASSATESKGAELLIDIEDFGEPDESVPEIEPWKTVGLEPDYGGQWIVAGDLDGDGEVEIVSAENVNSNDVHYTTSVAAQRLDGSVMWRWGNPNGGQKAWGYDVACQVYDWDGDGKEEVIFSNRGALVELDGASGREHRRISIADDATDCIVFCNLSGEERPTDVLVKNRYEQIWAYNREGKLLWTVSEPGGYRTAHQPRPIDLDGDGRHEIMAGYAMLNPDGSTRWVVESSAVELSKGHLDTIRVVHKGQTPEGFRMALTCCGAYNIAMIDGNGRTLWEVPGAHFESIDVGHIFPDYPGKQLLVDDGAWAGAPDRSNPMWIFDDQGKHIGRIATKYSRHHRLLDWDGDGLDEMFIAEGGAIYDHDGSRIGTLHTSEPPPGTDYFEKSLIVGDMDGDGIADITLTTPYAIYIYRNESGVKAVSPVSLGSGVNFTLY